MRTFFLLFIAGGGAYVLMELLWRGRSHISMFVVGGLCFALLDTLFSRYALALPLCCVIGSAVITSMEFISGYLVNIRMGLNVWDYSGVKGNLYGQICLPFSLLWCVMSIVILYAGMALHTIL